MPSPFDITVASNTVDLDNKREGVATFTVKNNTRRRLRASAKVSTQPPDGAKWLTILPPDSGGNAADARDFAIDATQQYQVKIAVPMDAAPASFSLKLTVADEVNPDDNFTESPDVVFTVREIPKPEPRKLPGWLIPVVIVVILLVVAVIAGVAISSNNGGNANATGTAVALANARQTVDALAAANAALTEQATAFAQQTAVQQTAAAQLTSAAQSANGLQTASAIFAQQTAVVQTAIALQTEQAIAIAQETAVASVTQGAGTGTVQAMLSPFVGTWSPTNAGLVDSFTITSIDNHQVRIDYMSKCPPDHAGCGATSQAFQYPHVTLFADHLSAIGAGLQMQIVPAGSCRLQVTSQAPGTSATLQTFQKTTCLRFVGTLSAIHTVPNLQFILEATATPG